MSIRFSTEAANADVLGEDTPDAGPPQGRPDGTGPDVVSGDRSGRAPTGRGKPGDSPAGDVKPGKDINAPGSVKDQDAGKPS